MKFATLLCAFIAGFGLSYGQLPKQMQKTIDQVRQQYAPDRRVAIFQIEADENGILTGKTNLPEAKSDLLQKLSNAGLKYQDSIQTLPAAILGEQIYGVVNLSVANIRSQPRDAAELATQALLGMPLKVLNKDRGWYLVQTPDHYIAWLDWGGFQRMNQADFESWEGAEKIIVLSPYTFSYEETDADGQTVSDLVAGDLLKMLDEKGEFYHVQYPDGRTAYIKKADARPYAEWLASLTISEDKLVGTAKRMMGLPYLWGGTSYKGVDCSGFTKTIYLLNGWVLPRDASQQVHSGTLVDTDRGFDKLRPGDLLFFGTKAGETTAEKVTHVGMWIGNGEFIHASGKVRVSSMNARAPNYDDFEKNRFIRAKRLLGNARGVQELKAMVN
ncbi:C40 family peptidase [Persicitalea jodogahamensis]|uniref:Cytochrome c n=1 Tax=Persicitalea jodogahamensis TaxID=402147 RepID=A0A8J3G7U8_9BACT|nr:C40 family peptidase [Persicitalea jodogahamensis]GHB53716.1 cytochrome c [Persicitalea jodogahamensis]